MSMNSSSARKRRRGRGRGILGVHARRIGLLVLNAIFCNRLMFRAVGWFNRRWPFLETLFVAYPASEEFASAYGYKWQQNAFRWRPWLCGAFRQGDKWGLQFAISGYETDFMDRESGDNLQQLVDWAESTKSELGANRRTFAGVLPGVMRSRRITKETPEAELTTKALVDAERAVRRAMGWREEDVIPVIVLGGRGFIGRRLVAALREMPWRGQVYTVDVAGEKWRAWPEHLKGQRAILVNAARRDALADYMWALWPELVVLNEVYPGPTAEELAQLRAVGCPVFHVVGVKAQCFPAFPGEYQGGVPCCAAMPQQDLDVIVNRLA